MTEEKNSISYEESSLKDFFERFIEIYPAQIKPLIEKGYYEIARVEFSNVNFILRNTGLLSLGNFTNKTYFSLATAIGSMEDSLKKNNSENIEHNMSVLEKCLENTKASHVKPSLK